MENVFKKKRKKVFFNYFLYEYLLKGVSVVVLMKTLSDFKNWNEKIK